jgi:hypothetical protein
MKKVVSSDRNHEVMALRRATLLCMPMLDADEGGNAKRRSQHGQRVDGVSSETPHCSDDTMAACHSSRYLPKPFPTDQTTTVAHAQRDDIVRTVPFPATVHPESGT